MTKLMLFTAFWFLLLTPAMYAGTPSDMPLQVKIEAVLHKIPDGTEPLWDAPAKSITNTSAVSPRKKGLPRWRMFRAPMEPD